jgi:hypothetical protein
MVIEEADQARLRRVRVMVAAAAALATVAAGGVVWAYGWRAGDAAPDAGGIVFIATLVHLAGTRWLRKRDRRADFGWRAALVVPDGVCAGLLARRSRRAAAIEAIAATGLVGGGLLMAGGRMGAGKIWSGALWSAFAGAMAVAVAVSVFNGLRRSGCVAVTSHGVAAGGRLVRWAEIESVRRDKDGVQLRIRSAANPRPMLIGGSQCAVSDERLHEVVEYFLTHPHRRSALDGGGPYQLALTTALASRRRA